jgi:hypothetical protein
MIGRDGYGPGTRRSVRVVHGDCRGAGRRARTARATSRICVCSGVKLKPPCDHAVWRGRTELNRCMETPVSSHMDSSSHGSAGEGKNEGEELTIEVGRRGGVLVQRRSSAGRDLHSADLMPRVLATTVVRCSSRASGGRCSWRSGALWQLADRRADERDGHLARRGDGASLEEHAYEAAWPARAVCR